MTDQADAPVPATGPLAGVRVVEFAQALAIPMCIFYELAILFGRIRERRERNAQAAL